MKNSWTFALVALVIGTLGGFISGRNTSPGGEGSEVASKPASPLASKAKLEARMKSDVARENTRPKRPQNIGKISSMPSSTQRVQAMLDLYANLGPAQFESEAVKLDQLPMNERMLASMLLFGRWAEVDPSAAMAYSGKLGYGMFVKPDILRSWASVDPMGAAQYLAANPREFVMMGPGGRGSSGVSVIGAEWAKLNPTAAIEWAGSLVDGRSEAISAVVGQVARMDPAKAAQMLSGVSGDDLSAAFQSVAASYGAKNFAEARAWISGLAPGQQADALAAAIGGLSRVDSSLAAEALDGMEQGPAKDRTIAQVVGGMARDNPQAAAAFLKGQESADAKRMAVRELIPVWVARDAPNALAYAYGLEAGDVRDSALQSYVMSNTAEDPSKVILAAENIQDEGERIRSMSIAATRWMREDATAAKAYVEESQLLPEADKNRILNGGGWFGGRFGGQRGVSGGSR